MSKEKTSRKIQYKKNFLTDVIFRIDFPVILDIAENTPKGFQNKILNDFPVLEPIQQFGVKIERKGSNIDTFTADKTTWRFSSPDKNYLTELDAEFLAVVCKKYSNFTDFKNTVSKILKSFVQLYPKLELAINRLGLRYINQIQLEESDFFGWQSYLNKSLITNLDFFENKNDLRRAMQVYEIMLEDDVNMNLKCGIFNSSFPAPVNKKEFILDYDCYTKTQLSRDQVIDKLTKFNEIAGKYFERSINDSLRKVLNHG
ncbi:TIGR04255 family protein [Patescibacteria group bacterium]|nr:TIGR04255 family protein [Patescibacteria group bacterium]